MPAHRPSLQVVHGVPSEIDAGAEVAVTVHASCAHGCALSGAPIQLIAGDAVVHGVLADDEGGPAAAGAAAALAVRVPARVGAFVWSVAFPRHETDGVVHEETTVPLEFATVPHKTSMAVWDVRSPAAADSGLTAKVGLRCAVGCRLTGQRVDVLDESGARVGVARLGDAPWAGTDALYWGDVELRTPPAEGLSTRHATFADEGLELPHELSTASFTFWTTRPPEHRVSIAVIDQNTGVGVADVEVRLGLYMATTDAQGVVNMAMPAGRFELSIRKDGFTAPPTPLDVADDLTVRVEAVPAPTMAERAEKLTSFEGYPWG